MIVQLVVVTLDAVVATATAPVSWLVGRLSELNVTKVELLVAVILAAVPVVFWFSVGMSAATIARYVGAPADPFGAAKK